MDDFRKQALFNAGLIVLGFAACVGVATWLAGGVQKQAAHIVTERAQLRGQAQSLQLLAEFKQISGDVEFYTTKLKAFVPTEDGILDFRRWVRSLGDHHGVVVSEVVFRGGASVSPEALGYNEFDLNVDGTEQQLGGFLHGLEVNAPKYLAQLMSIELSNSGSAYRLQARGRVYFR